MQTKWHDRYTVSVLLSRRTGEAKPQERDGKERKEMLAGAFIIAL